MKDGTSQNFSSSLFFVQCVLPHNFPGLGMRTSHSLWNPSLGNGITTFTRSPLFHGIAGQQTVISSASARLPQTDTFMNLAQGNAFLKSTTLQLSELLRIRDQLVKERDDLQEKLTQGIACQPAECSSTTALSPQTDTCMQMVQELLRKQDQLIKEKEELQKLLFQEKELLQMRLFQEKEELQRRLYQEKDELQKRLFQEKDELKDKLIAWKLSQSEERINYARLKSEWLKANRCLNGRRVFEDFETNHISEFQGKREKKWKDFLASKKTKASEIREAAGQKQLEITTIPAVAASLFKRLSEDIHKGFERGNKVVIKTSYLSEEEAQLMRIVCILLPIHEDDIEEDDSPMNPILEDTWRT